MKIALGDYPLTCTSIKLKTGGVQLTRIADPDRFLEQLSREDSAGRLYLPYWTYLWDSAIGLARHVEKIGSRLNGTDVLEIGCGFGLTGIVACLMGARVVFTDVEQEALRFAAHNAAQNAVLARADFVQMDWNAPCFTQEFRTLLAADVIYEAAHWTPIIALLQTCLHPNGNALFSEPGRSNAPEFLKQLCESGFTYQTATYSGAPDSDTPAVRIYTVRHAN